MADDQFFIAAPQALGSSWYPHSFMEEEKRNDPYLSASIEDLKNLIEEIAKHIPKEKIFIAGFSQGACLTLEVSARNAAKYGGIIAFTGGLIGAVIDPQKYQGNFEGAKVFISNGDRDPHVPLIRCEESKEIMENQGALGNLESL